MRLYFSGGIASFDLFQGIPGDYGLLASYLEVRKKQEIPKLGRRLFLDSGAFSVFTGKAKVDRQEYADFLKVHGGKVDVYANLDVIGDPVETEKNQLFLEGQGLLPLPTFHFRSPYSVLEKMIDRYEYVGLGGLVPIAKQKTVLFRHLDTCFNLIAKRRGKLKTHGWGMTGPQCLFRYPFYTVDSTSWVKFAAYKTRLKYDGLALKCDRGTLSRIKSGQTLNVNNILQYVRVVEEATLLWKKRGVEWND